MKKTFFFLSEISSKSIEKKRGGGESKKSQKSANLKYVQKQVEILNVSNIVDKNIVHKNIVDKNIVHTDIVHTNIVHKNIVDILNRYENFEYTKPKCGTLEE